MTSLPNRRVLFVDDEPRVLDGMVRRFMDKAEVTTAESGELGLQRIAEAREPFAVIVSDERMPGLSGAAFLSLARERSPSSVRMLLTGQTNWKAAVDAVNEGQIYRFLCKPCPPEALTIAIEAGIEQHRLLVSEREIMERTLTAVVKTLTDVLSLTAPDLFNRGSLVKGYVSHIVRALALEGAWQIEVAASLHTLGLMALPPEVAHRGLNGLSLSSEQKSQLATHPAIAKRILHAIPRLEEVAEIVEQQLAETPIGSPLVRSGAALLRLGIKLESRVAAGMKLVDAIEWLHASVNAEERPYDDALRSYCAGAERMILQELSARDLAPHMVLESDVTTRDGALIVPKGRELNPVLIERLRNFSASRSLREPIRVLVSSSHDGERATRTPAVADEPAVTVRPR